MPPQLGAAPVRVGDFAAVQSSLHTVLPPAHPVAPAVTGFNEFHAVAAKEIHTVSVGTFANATTAPSERPAHMITGESGFGAASVARPGSAQPEASVSTRSAAPVEIQFKPLPEYTEEARRRHVEGEVLLEMLFTASGEARMLRVVRGLGYGLDEAAAAAARQIRFLPARRNGSPVDSRAVVHIQFQLAY
jgi:TonB family protein